MIEFFFTKRFGKFFCIYTPNFYNDWINHLICIHIQAKFKIDVKTVGRFRKIFIKIEFNTVKKKNTD